MALDRNQVPAERKWRVEDIFESVDAWNATYAECEGELDFAALAVTGGPAGEPGVFCAPCGVCRQMLSEFCTPEMPVISGAVGKLQVYALGELLPLAFGPRDVLPDHT